MKISKKIYCPLISQELLSINFCLSECKERCQLPKFFRQYLIENSEKTKIYSYIYKCTQIAYGCPYYYRFLKQNKFTVIEILKKIPTTIGKILHYFFEIIEKENYKSELQVYKDFILPPRVRLYGTIDLIKYLNDKEVELYDLKFSKITEPPFSYILQLNIYKYLYEHNYPHTVKNLFLYVLSNSGWITLEVPILSKEYIEQLIIERLNIFYKILNYDDNFVSIINEDNCKFCPKYINEQCKFSIKNTIDYSKVKTSNINE